MVIASRIVAGAGMAALLLPCSALADSPAPGEGDATGAAVTVMRGGRTEWQREAQAERGVVVMRPQPGSFMRETARLAAEAEARETEAARSEARRVNRRLLAALQAVQEAAGAVESRQGGRHVFIIAPRSIRDRRPGKLPPAHAETPAPSGN